MNKLVEQFWGRALKLAHDYKSDDITFADLTGLVDDYSASLTEALSRLPEPERQDISSGLEQKFNQALENPDHNPSVREALAEISTSLNRIPIY